MKNSTYLTAILFLIFFSCTNEDLPVSGNVSGLNQENWAKNVKPRTVVVGQSYQGGIVGYVDESRKHGLIVAPDEKKVVYWGCPLSLISGAFHVEFGYGNQNTLDILNGCSEDGIAARYCNDLDMEVLGYNDWYLPSRNELEKLYINRLAIGGFADGYYWSSSEGRDGGVWVLNFKNGDQFLYHKDDPGYVRAVRTF